MAAWVRGRDQIPILFVAAAQLVTRERIEVLALTPAAIDASTDLASLLNRCEQQGIRTILPWGLGKWLGARGARIRNVLTERDRSKHVLIGDIGGRPWVWPRPSLLGTLERCGYRSINGTDPLPVSAEEARVGSYGSWHSHPTANSTIADLSYAEVWQRLFVAPATFERFGRSAGLLACLNAQMALRLYRAA